MMLHLLSSVILCEHKDGHCESRERVKTLTCQLPANATAHFSVNRIKANILGDELVDFDLLVWDSTSSVAHM